MFTAAPRITAAWADRHATPAAAGVLSDDWFVTNGGDGFWSQIDPTDPNIVYAESQYGGMVRYDRKSQEAIDIRPEPRKGEYSYRWNWNTPLLLSPHSHTRLYTVQPTRCSAATTAAIPGR